MIFKILNRFIRCVFVATAAVGAMSINPAVAENVIAAANHYTVKVRSSTTYAFGLDKKETTSGAGFLIDRSAGWIMTNAHVASRSPSNITASFRNEDSIPATKLYVDSHHDLAILKIDPALIPQWATEARLSCNSDPDEGAPVIAFGHPWKHDFTSTRGIISGSKTVEGEELLQTDAALNPGNSGGPLIDAANGNVLGINTSGMDVSKSEGVHFAVPAYFICTITSLLRQGLDPAPAKLPFFFAETEKSNELVIAVSDPRTDDVFQSGDRILQVDDDNRIFSESRFLNKLRGKNNVRIRYLRQGRELEVNFKVPELKNRNITKGIYFSGALVGPPTIKEGAIGLLIVHDIDPASLAERSLIQAADQIISIDGQKMDKFEELRSALLAKSGRYVEIVTRRPTFSLIEGRFEYYARKLLVQDIREVSEEN